jgi:probable HAF family extracellular repeat protein
LIQATDINSAGQVLGSVAQNFPSFPFIYTIATQQTLILNASGQFGIGGSPVDINDAGHAVYNTEVPFAQTGRAVLYRNGTETNIGSLGGFYTNARAMNDADAIVGLSTVTAGGWAHAFLYANGHMTDLGASFPYYSVADQINDAGHVLGQYQVTLDSSKPFRAFFYDGTAVWDLTDLVSGLPPGWVLNDASFYAGTDDIVAIGRYGSRSTVFLLSIPEPACALGATGLAFILLTRFRANQFGAARPLP